MKITHISKITKDKFDILIAKYNFFIKIYEDYELVIENSNISIRFGTFSRENGATLVVTAKESNDRFYLINIALQKGILLNKYSTYMDKKEVKDMYILDGTTEGIFYCMLAIIEKYCDDIIAGDFSIMYGENSEFIYGMHRFK